MATLKKYVHVFERFVKIQSFILCLKTIADHGVRKGKILFLFIFTCASSLQCNHASVKKITHSELPLGDRWQTTGCFLKDGSILTQRRLGVFSFCCSWQPPEPLNMESFIWVPFVNSKYPRPGFLPSYPNRFI